MQHLFSLCLLHTRVSGSTNLLAAASSSSSGSNAVMTALSYEMRLVREDSAWWLEHKPEVSGVLQFLCSSIVRILSLDGQRLIPWWPASCPLVISVSCPGVYS